MSNLDIHLEGETESAGIVAATAMVCTDDACFRIERVQATRALLTSAGASLSELLQRALKARLATMSLEAAASVDAIDLDREEGLK